MAIAVAGVCSCDHEDSNLDAKCEFRWVFTKSQEQTPATAYLIFWLFPRLSPKSLYGLQAFFYKLTRI